MPSKVVERKDGSKVTVIADSDSELKDAVKAAQTNPMNKIDINRPVQEGYDLVVVNQDGSQELSDQVPEDALNFNPEVNQNFNKGGTGAAGTASNSPAAKAAANAAADAAEKLGGSATEKANQEARAELQNAEKPKEEITGTNGQSVSSSKSDKK